jgi:hypothetical protein
MAGQGFPVSCPSLLSPREHCAHREVQGLSWSKSHYSEHHSAESHYACSGAVVASHSGA